MKMRIGVLAAVAGLMLTSAAMASGIYTNGLPVAGGAQYPSTLPLTGNELVPADTQLPGGLNPATEAVSIGQLADYATIPTISTATNVAAFTATAAQVSPTLGGQNSTLLLTGTLTAGTTLTTPTAAAIFAALPAVATGQQYLLKFSNESSGAFAWTIAGGTGVTVTGSATVAQGTSRVYLVTVVSASSVTLVDAGN